MPIVSRLKSDGFISFPSLVVCCSVEGNTRLAFYPFQAFFILFFNLFSSLFVYSLLRFHQKHKTRGEAMNEELIKMHLTLTPVQRARVIDAARAEGFVTPTQWMRIQLMKAAEQVEQKRVAQ